MAAAQQPIPQQGVYLFSTGNLPIGQEPPPSLDPNQAQMDAAMSKTETQLYGHSYANQPLGKRLTRVEKTLYGSQQTGTQESRLQQIGQRMKQDKGLPSVTSQASMIEFLEQRFYQRTFPELPTEQRVHQLELYVYGKTFDKDPIDRRVKKLTYTVPLMAKEVRLTKEGAVLATTAPRKGVAVAKAHPNIPADYFEAVYKLPNARILRWMNLPVKVYVQRGTEADRLVVAEAIRQWNGVYPVQLTANSSDADVIVDWAGTAPLPYQPITRPTHVMTDPKSIRTVIQINMTGYSTAPNPAKIRGMLHQLGHAAGLWGHSDEPKDIMYPLTAMEATDIPENWNRGTLRFSNNIPEPVEGGPPIQPSERDRNTMVQVYSFPGEDLRQYSPHR
jgi:hypothetical protein